MRTRFLISLSSSSPAVLHIEGGTTCCYERISLVIFDYKLRCRITAWLSVDVCFVILSHKVNGSAMITIWRFYFTNFLSQEEGLLD